MKNYSKKIIALMLTIALTLSTFAFNNTAVFAEGIRGIDYSSAVNSIYKDITVKPSAPSATSLCSSSSYAATTPDFNSIKDAAEYVRSQMVKRASTITFVVNMPYYSTLVKEIFEEAVKDSLSGSSSEGDYLYSHWKSYKSSASYTSTKATITMTMTYLTTYAQEQKVDEKVKQVLDSLNVYNADDYTKALAVHNYIVKNVDYDYSYANHSAYDAIVSGKVVCQGFSALTYKMLKELGVGVKYITGTANGGGHAWNIASIDSKWYNLDNTWDQNLGSSTNICYDYFLNGSTEFDKEHARDDKYNTAAFKSSFPVSATAYTAPDMFNTPVENVKVSEVSGFKFTSTTSTIKLSWDEASNVSGYEIWMYKSSAGDFVKQKTITSASTLSYTRTSLSSSSTSRYKIRAYKTVDGVKHYSNFSDVLYTSTKPLKPNLTVTSPAKGKASLTWTNTSSRNSGYQVRRATSSTGTYYLKKTTTSKSYSQTGLTSGKYYYYKVRAFKTLSNGKKVYGSYSTIKSVKVK